MWTVRRMAQCLWYHPECSACMLTCDSTSLCVQCLACPCLSQLVTGIPRNTDFSSASIRETVHSGSSLTRACKTDAPPLLGFLPSLGPLLYGSMGYSWGPLFNRLTHRTPSGLKPLSMTLVIDMISCQYQTK